MKTKEDDQPLSTRQQLKQLKLLMSAGHKNESFRVKALAFACELLTSKKLTFPIFRESFDTIWSLDVINWSAYRSQLESAFSRLTRAVQKFVIWWMLDYYVHLEDWEAARRCILVEEVGWSDMENALRVALRLGDQQLLKALRRRAKSMLDVPSPNYELLTALARHYCESGEWEEAIAYWQRATEFIFCAPQAIAGIAEAHARMALAQLALAEKKLPGLKAIAEADPEMDKQYYGGSWVADAEHELNFYSGLFKNLLELDRASRRNPTPAPSTKEHNNEH